MRKTDAGPSEPAAVGVSFHDGGKVYFFKPNGIDLRPGDHVLAKTERGVDIGEVISVKKTLTDGDDITTPMKPLLRRATRDDTLREQVLRERERQASMLCRKKIKEHDLPMKLVKADYTFDGKRLTFFFSSEGRVDFRALVRDLAETFGCRIELRQIGVRDEAKMLGGIGPCGRPLCCAQWLREFAPVGIKVAKEQGMSLNPAKISGVCDRLMCCLLYEHEVYKDLAERMPKTGEEVRGQGRTGRVKSVTLLRERVSVEFHEAETTEIVEVSVADLRRSRGYWRLIGTREVKPFSPVDAPPAREPRRPAKTEPNVIVREPRRTDEDRPATEKEPGEETSEKSSPEKEGRRRRRPRSRRSGAKQKTEQSQAATTPEKTQEKAAAGAQPGKTGKQGETAEKSQRSGRSRRRRRRPAKRGEGGDAGAKAQDQQAKPADGKPKGEQPQKKQPDAGSEAKGDKPAGQSSKRKNWRRRRPRSRPKGDGQSPDKAPTGDKTGKTGE